MGKILLDGMKFFAYHGTYQSEHQKGNNFSVDLEIEFDTDKAAETDNLELTVNYESLFYIVREEMGIASKLLEHVAKRIQDSINAKYPNIENMKIRVTKFNPPLDGDCEKVTVEL
ncbi:MAG: dihydroneopterin aldolase [Bacteroidetes bacterium]|nr:dihydroneopterin aldolase [Bacteroidota bacterium]